MIHFSKAVLRLFWR